MSIVDVTDASFESDVIQAARPVVVDFWAAWCGPCRHLSPVLERLADEAGGSWILAKVDVDSNPRLAQAFGIQGIPAVQAFKDGHSVAEFVGALPEARVRDWLRGLGPSPADALLEDAARAEDGGDLEGAARLYRQALDADPGHQRARAAFARVALALRSSLVDEQEALRRLQEDPSDIDAIVDLADVKAARGEVEAAFQRLVEAIRSTTGPGRERARTHLLNLLETLPPSDPRAMAARRALSMALF
jgi:putative thioredoxin